MLWVAPAATVGLGEAASRQVCEGMSMGGLLGVEMRGGCLRTPGHSVDAGYISYTGHSDDKGHGSWLQGAPSSKLVSVIPSSDRSQAGNVRKCEALEHVDSLRHLGLGEDAISGQPCVQEGVSDAQ